MLRLNALGGYTQVGLRPETTYQLFLNTHKTGFLIGGKFSAGPKVDIS